MQSLLALIASPVKLSLTGEVVEFRQIRIRQLPDVFRACAPIPDLLNVEVDQIDLKKIVVMQPVETVTLLSVLTDLSVSVLAGLDDDDRLSLLSMMIAINRTFFTPKKPLPKPTGRAAKAPGDGWADRIDALVAAGHRFADILDYTWSQFVTLSEAAARRQRRQSREQFRLMLIAQRGEKEEVRAVLRED